MANAVLHRVWNTSQTRGAMRCLLLALADVADERGIAYPGVPHLASMINESTDYTGKLIDKLIGTGELFKIAGRGRGHVTRFAVLCGLTDAKQAHLKGVLQDPFSIVQKGHPSTPLEKRGTPIGVLQSDKRGTLSDSNDHTNGASEPHEPPITKNDNHGDPHVGDGGGVRTLENYLSALPMFPKTITQILALNLDPPTVIAACEMLRGAGWGIGSIADHIRKYPPVKGQPYAKPEPARAAGDVPPARSARNDRPALPQTIKHVSSAGWKKPAGSD